jgi:isochorismate hydrolase
MDPRLERLTPDNSAVLVVDVQERFLKAIREVDRVVSRSARLARAAQILDVPVILSEQVPEKLGPTHPDIRGAVPGEPLAKSAFSCCGDSPMLQAVRDTNAQHLLIVGIEAHVCIRQTALDLLRLAPDAPHPVLCVDAISSRFAVDQDVALRELAQVGARLTTTEAVMFEWMQDATHPQFRDVQLLVR